MPIYGEISDYFIIVTIPKKMKKHGFPIITQHFVEEEKILFICHGQII